jgi:hypothetical protein
MHNSHYKVSGKVYFYSDITPISCKVEIPVKKLCAQDWAEDIEYRQQYP